MKAKHVWIGLILLLTTLPSVGNAQSAQTGILQEQLNPILTRYMQNQAKNFIRSGNDAGGAAATFAGTFLGDFPRLSIFSRARWVNEDQTLPITLSMINPTQNDLVYYRPCVSSDRELPYSFLLLREFVEGGSGVVAKLGTDALENTECDMEPIVIPPGNHYNESRSLKLSDISLEKGAYYSFTATALGDIEGYPFWANSASMVFGISPNPYALSDEDEVYEDNTLDLEINVGTEWYLTDQTMNDLGPDDFASLVLQHKESFSTIKVQVLNNSTSAEKKLNDISNIYGNDNPTIKTVRSNDIRWKYADMNESNRMYALEENNKIYTVSIGRRGNIDDSFTDLLELISIK